MRPPPVLMLALPAAAIVAGGRMNMHWRRPRTWRSVGVA